MMQESKNMKYQKALVTGGAGFIGSHIAEQLLETGMDVVVLDNLSIGKQKNIPNGASFVQGDIRDQETVSNIMAQGVDVIFHQAAKVSIRASIDNCYEDADTNLMGTVNLLRACQNSDVKQFIFASSMGIYADSEKAEPIDENFTAEPASPYGIAKFASEKYCLLLCRKFGIRCAILRYFNTYGPRQTFTPYVGVITIFTNLLLDDKRPVIFGDGQQLRDYVHVRDVARANLLTMESSQRELVLNIGTGRAVSVNQIYDMLRERINPAISPEYDKERPGELKISFPDISRARKLIAYNPVHTLEDDLDEVIEYIRSYRGQADQRP